jgi:hypothetical protein
VSRRRWIAVALAAAVLLLLGRAAAASYAEYLWYASLDALDVWRTRVAAMLSMRALAAAAWSAFLLANLFAVRRSVVSIRVPRQLGNLEIGEEISPRLLDALAVGGSLALGVLLSFAHDDWGSLLRAYMGVPFGEIEPYFELDLGFFVYWLPFETSLRDVALVAVLVAGAIVIFLYALTPSLSRERGSLYVSQYVRRHLFALLAALILVLAWSYRLDAYHLLVEGSGQGGVLTYADLHGTIPASTALSIIAVAAAAIVLWAGWTGQVRVAFVSVGALLVLAMGLRQIAPWLARRSAPAAERRERPFAATRATYTRRAYAADRVVMGRAPSFASAAELARGTPLWDQEALERAVGRGAGERIPAVEWRAADDGAIVATVPIAPGSATEWDGRAWRVARLAAWTADARGEPALAPGASEDAQLPPPLVVDSVAAPIAVADTSGGIAAPTLRSFLSRLAHAWSLQDYSLLGDDLPRPQPRLVSYRDVRTRVRRLAPLFTQAEHVAAIVDGDSLYWAVELYATSRSYPLSRPLTFAGQEVRYARPAAVALVNAHSGRVTLYAAPSPDPVARTWMRLVPESFAPRRTLPPRLAAALPPPIDAAAAQAAAFAMAGTRDAGPRGAHLPRADGAEAAFASGAPSLIALGRDGDALAWTTPVLDDEDRVLGLLVTTGGAERTSFWLPAAGAPRRWTTVIDALRGATDSTAAGREPRVAHGPVRALPLAGGIAYAQTAYATRPDGTPVVSRAAVLLPDGSVEEGATFGAALGTGAPTAVPAPLTAAAFEARVRALYEQMRATLAAGDWVGFGAAYDALGELLRSRQ